VVITRQAYQQIGGFDENFIGWGGEDNEFWERALTRNAWPWGFLPLLHLWHEAQPGKDRENPHGASRYRDLSRIPPGERIRTLVNPGRETC
jgi:GT2 family glycosyltransferase